MMAALPFNVLIREQSYSEPELIIQTYLNDDLTKDKIENLPFLKVFITLILNILIKINYWKRIVF